MLFSSGPRQDSSLRIGERAHYLEVHAAQEKYFRLISIKKLINEDNKYASQILNSFGSPVWLVRVMPSSQPLHDKYE